MHMMNKRSGSQARQSIEKSCLLLLKQHLDNYFNFNHKPDLLTEIKKINQLDKLIKALNHVHQEHQILTPFIHTFLFELMRMTVLTPNVFEQLKYLKTQGLNYLAWDAMGNSTLTPLVTRANDAAPIDLVFIKFLIEELQCKVQNFEPNHPISIALINNKRKIYDYLVETLPVYSCIGDTLLTMAVRYGYTPLVKKTIEKSPHLLNTSDGAGYTPLMYAVMFKRAESAKLLLARNPDLYAKTPEGLTASHLAFNCTGVAGCLDIQDPDTLDAYKPVIDLIFEINDIRLQDNNGLYPLHYYPLNSENTSQYINLLTHNPDLLLLKDKHNRTLIYYALKHYSQPLLDYLPRVCPELKLDAVDLNSKTALNYAVNLGSFDTLAWLTTQDHLHFNQTMHASALLDAMVIDDKEMVDFLLSIGKCDLDAYYDTEDQPNKNSLLHALIHWGHSECIARFDLFRRIKPEFAPTRYKNSLNKTAIDLFFDKHLTQTQESFRNEFMGYLVNYFLTESEYKLSEIPSQIMLSLLKSKQIDVHDNLGEAVFHSFEARLYQEAQESTNFPESYEKKLSEFVKNYQPNINQRDERTNLHILAKLAQLGEMGYKRIRVLCQNFPELTTLDLDALGSSLLHVACEQGHFELTRWCVNDHSLDILQERSDGLNAFDIAIKQNDRLICKFFTTKLSQKKWSMYITSRQSDEGVVNHLIQHAFFGFKPNSKVRKALAKLNNPELQQYFVALNSTIIEEETSTSLSQACDVLSMSPQKINCTDIEGIIRSNKVSVIKQLKHKEDILDFDINPETAFLQALNLILLAATQEHRGLLYHLWRIKPLKNKLLFAPQKMLNELLTRCGNDTQLSILLDEQTLSLLTPDDKFNLLLKMQALNLMGLLKLWLKFPDFASVAHYNSNQLIRLTIQNRQVSLREALLEHQTVIDAIAEQYKELLRFACEMDDEDTLITLLNLPEVVFAIEKNDFELIRECINDDDSLLSHKLKELDCVARWLSEAHSHPEAIEPQLVACPIGANKAYEKPAILVGSSRHKKGLPRKTETIQRRTRHLSATRHQPLPIAPALITPQSNTTFFAPQPMQLQPIFPAYLGALPPPPIQFQPLPPPIIMVHTEEYHNRHYSKIFDAITMDNLDLFYNLLITQTDISHQWIRNMALSAIHFNAQTIFFNYFLRSAVVVQDSDFIHRLLKEAMPLGNRVMINRLFYSPSIQLNLDRYGTQILHTAIQCGYADIALMLINVPSVTAKLAEMDYYVLRHAAASGLVELVERLLTIDHVYQNASILNHSALRKAHQALLFQGEKGPLKDAYQRIILSLLSVPEVLNYACQKGTVYADMIILYASQQLKFWINQQKKLSNDQIADLLLFDQYPAITEDLELRGMIKQLKQDNYLSSFTEMSFWARQSQLHQVGEECSKEPNCDVV